MQNNFVPWLRSRPKEANQSPPRRQMVWENTTREDMKKSFEQLFQKNAIALFLTGATATVSTLATVVGHPNTPISAGNGGLSLGLPAFPSRLSIRACGWGGGEEGEGWKEGEEERFTS